MRTRKKWSDRSGKVSIVVVAVLVVALLSLSSLVAVYMISTAPWVPPDYDSNGDGVSDAVFGYLVVDAPCKFDKTQSSYIQSVDSIAAHVASQSSQMSFTDFLSSFGILNPNTNFKTTFTVTAPQFGSFYYSETIGYHVDVASGVSLVKDVSPTREIGLRAHGTYHIVVELLNGAGTRIDIKYIDTVV